jgi:MFS family permease
MSIAAAAEKKISLYPLLWVMLFDHTSLNITFPVLTLIFFDVQSSLFAAATTHAVRSMWYGLAVAVPHLVNIVVTPLLCALSDTYGRKKILFVGTLGAMLFALTAGAGVIMGVFGLLFTGLIIRGAFSRTNPIAQAVVGDISTKDQKVRAMGYLQFAIGTGAFIGPVVGGYFANQFLFERLNFSLPFFLAALFAGVSCLLTLLVFRETLPSANRTSSTSGILSLATFKKVLANSQVLRISAVLFLSQFSWSLYYQFIPPVLKTTQNFSAHALGLFVGMIAFWLALATSVGIRLLEKFFSRKQMLVFSLYLVLLGLLLTVLFCLPAVSSYAQTGIWIAAIPVAIGDVIAFSCLIAMYSDVVAPAEQGKVMGICFVVVAVIWSLTGLLGGMLMSLHALMPLVVAPLGIIFSVLLLHTVFNRSIH